MLVSCSGISLFPAPTPSPTPAPVFPPPLALDPVAKLENQITYLTHAGDGSDRIFITERIGRIRIIKGGRLLPTPFLDIRELVDSASIEQGLLSIAFDPNYELNGEFYIYYTNLATDNDTVIARYRVSEDPDVADPNSRQEIFFLEQPANNHNGGLLLFGPDNYLYVGLGDGGSGNDPWDHGQRLDSLLGKVLRLDVRGHETYEVPNSNPFVRRESALPEIWAYGLRNPWRFTFDPATGDFYLGDVGEREVEELNFVPAGGASGLNYGWNTLEGTHCFDPKEGCSSEGIHLPIYDYVHGEAGCSITGGLVYRGHKYPTLIGTYFFSDFCTGTISGARRDSSGSWQIEALLDTEAAAVSFGNDEAGELYFLDLNGQVFQVVAGSGEAE